MSGLGRSAGGSGNRPVKNYLQVQYSNGLRGGVDIGYPYEIHYTNGGVK